jgi:hypothetical protein
MLPRRRANKSQPSRCDIFLTGRVLSVLWGLGGPGRGVSGVRRGLRHEGAVQEGGRGEGNKKGGRELLKKRRGTSASLYLVKDRADR